MRRKIALAASLVIVLTISPTYAADAKCNLSNDLTIEGSGIWPSVTLSVDFSEVRVLPGERMGKTPRGEEELLGPRFALTGGCVRLEHDLAFIGEIDFYRSLDGRPVVRQKGTWYEPDAAFAAMVERAVSLAQVVSRVRAAGAL